MRAKSLLSFRSLVVGSLMWSLSSASAWAGAPGRIVVVHDEFPLSNTGYAQAGVMPDRFAKNVADWFTGGVPGDFLAYSINMGLTGSSLATSMSGHTWTVSSSTTFTLAVLSQYDGIFLAGTTAGVNTAVLVSYVQAGGNVYLCAGTGNGGATVEANFWNPFLAPFGLQFTGGSYNGLSGVQPIASTHPIFSGVGGVVTGLYQASGNSIVDLAPANPDNQVLVTNGTHGLYAVYARATPGFAFCIGDNLPATEPGLINCPCTNPGGVNRGCENPSVARGGRLTAVGNASNGSNSLRLLAQDLAYPNGLGVFVEGGVASVIPFGTPFGHGIRCVGGRMRRIGRCNADVWGTCSIQAPTSGIGATRNYQLFYKDPTGVGTCVGTHWNATNAWRVTWTL
ncbi:MAG: hypothetical protein ACKVWV_04800 [Planctomycetota bacterium]